MTAPHQAAHSFRMTHLWGFIHVNNNVLHNWDLDSITTRTILTAALVIALSGAIPLMDSVHGQQPKSDLDYEVQHLQEEMKDLRNVPTEIALIQAELSIQSEWHKEDQELKSKMVDGFLAVIGAICLATLVWLLNQTGITFGKK